MHGVMSEAYQARQQETHTREFRIRSYRWTPDLVGSTGGKSELLGLTLPGGRVIYDIPVEDGEITVDSTDEYTRRLRIVVPGEEWVPTSASSPLAPMGQFLSVHVRLDMPDGTWGPLVKLGEFPIISNEIDRPTGTVIVEAADWSHRVDEFQFTALETTSKTTHLADDVKAVVTAALPNRVYTAKVSRRAEVAYYEQKPTARFGEGRWEYVRKVCSDNGLEALFDRNGDLVIRNAVFDADGFDTGVADHRLGSIDDPVGMLSEDRGGNIISLRPKTTRENAANGIYLRIVPASDGKKTQAGKEQIKSATVDKGDALFGDVFGRITLTEQVDVKTITQKVLTDTQAKANAMRSRRGGVMRQLEIQCLPQWHIDIDDRIAIRWRKRMPDYTELITTEIHYVESFTWPLTPEGAMTIRTRQVAKQKLEQPWEMEPEPDPDYVPPPIGDIPTPPGEVVPVPPPPTMAPALQILEKYRAEIAANPSRYPVNYCYGKVTSIQDGDTLTATIYSDSACTKPSTIPHPDGKYGSMRLRFIGVQAQEKSWAFGAAAEAHLRTIVSVGSRVMIRWDDVVEADHDGIRRVWVEVYVWRDLEKDWRNLTLHMIDDGWGYAFPLRKAARNADNRIARTKQAMWHGYGLFATPGAHHGNLVISVTGNPSGDDTGSNEFATILNKSTAPISVAGWRFGDASPTYTMTFPAGATIPAGGTIKVRVGKGTNNVAGGVYYQQSPGALWNNDGDVAYLWDTNWRCSAAAHFRANYTEQVLIRPTVPAAIDDAELSFPAIGG